MPSQQVSSFFPRIVLVLMLVAASAIAQAEDRQMEIFGWIEKVKLAPEGLNLRAKLDTGADHSSLNAPKVEKFEKDGNDWVRFTVENEDGDATEFEKPIERTARIRSATGTSERHVVKMTVCLGDILREVEVNLADRSALSYQMLIGRSYLKDHILVDSGRTETMTPECDMELAQSDADDD